MRNRWPSACRAKEVVAAIIERFARLSAPYGTKVELARQPAPIGVIRIAG